MVQAVGPADISMFSLPLLAFELFRRYTRRTVTNFDDHVEGGHFISKYFKYIGGIDECVYGKVSFDTPAFTWYTYITSW